MEINRRAQGLLYEELALGYLEEQGYRLVKRNFQFGRTGEIDLVMRDGSVYVFVEVKGRRTHSFGMPEDSITPQKRMQIRRTAEGFAYVMRLTDFEGRFDVVTVDFFGTEDGLPVIKHFKDAFR